MILCGQRRTFAVLHHLLQPSQPNLARGLEKTFCKHSDNRATPIPVFPEPVRTRFPETLKDHRINHVSSFFLAGVTFVAPFDNGRLKSPLRLPATTVIDSPVLRAILTDPRCGIRYCVDNSVKQPGKAK